MQLRKHGLVLLSGALIIFGVSSSYAATTVVTATIKFFTDLTVAVVTAPNFGDVKAGQAGVYVLDPLTGLVTASGGGVTEGGVTAAGSYTIAGSTTQVINISAGGYTPSGASTPSAANCSYNSGAEVANCAITGGAAPGAGKNLKVGLQINTTAAATNNEVDTPSFALTVVYQ